MVLNGSGEIRLMGVEPITFGTEIQRSILIELQTLFKFIEYIVRHFLILSQVVSDLDLQKKLIKNSFAFMLTLYLL